MSGKRKRSDGDAKGGVSMKLVKRREKRPCKHCGKIISGNTKHPISACEREIARRKKLHLSFDGEESSNVELSPQFLKLIN